MGLLNRIEELEKELLELKEQVKEQQEFPKVGEYYFYIGDTGDIYRTEYAPPYNDDDYECRESIGNIFKNRDEACFAVEKLKVEAELRKFSRPFKEGENENWFILWGTYKKEVQIDWSRKLVRQGTIYFESRKKANEAVESVGEERIKKYIFGVEE